MRKTIVGFLILLATTLVALPAQADLSNTQIFFKIGDVNGYLNGSPEKFAVAPYLKTGTVMVPISLLAENLGLEVVNNAKIKTVTLKQDKATLQLVIGKKDFILNGKKKTVAIAPEILKGQIMVPINLINGNLGVSVKYYSDIKGISIANIPNFNFKPATTDSWKFLLPDGWQAKQGDRSEMTVSGEGVGFVFNKLWLNVDASKKELLKSYGDNYIKKVNGKIKPDSGLSDTNIYRAEFEFQGVDAKGKIVDYTAEINVKPELKTITYIVEYTPKNINIKSELIEKLYFSENSVKEKKPRN